jgi:hypothetical protein
VNSALRLTRSPRAIQMAPCQTIWSTISNNLTTAWLAACAGSPLAGVRPVVYLFDRAAWWAAWLASAQRRAPVPANGGYGFSTSAVAPPDWVRLGDFLERVDWPAVRATVGATSGACAPTVAIGLAASAVAPMGLFQTETMVWPGFGGVLAPAARSLDLTQRLTRSDAKITQK